MADSSKHRLAHRLTAAVAKLPRVTVGKSRFSPRTAFFVGRREFMHFHHEHEVDVRLTRPEIRARRAVFAEDARITMRGSSDWIEVRFDTTNDVADVVALARIAAKANAI